MIKLYTPRYKKYLPQWQKRFKKDLLKMIQEKRYINIDLFNKKQLLHFLDTFILELLTQHQITFFSTQRKLPFVQNYLDKVGCNYEPERLVPGSGRKGARSVWIVKTLGYKFG